MNNSMNVIEKVSWWQHFKHRALIKMVLDGFAMLIGLVHNYKYNEVNHLQVSFVIDALLS